VLNLKRMLVLFLEHRQVALTRRTRFELRKAQDRAHILEGLKIALDHLDAVIRTIRQSESAAKALTALIERYRLSELQARAILDMQLRRLAALERQEILDELAELLKTINYLEDLLANPRKILGLVREELLDLKKKYGDARRSRIALDDNPDISIEDTIANVDTLVTVSNRGYVKRLPPDTYRAQRRGGRGIIGGVFRDEDVPRHIVVTKAHDNILFFTDRGRVFQLKAHQIPEADRTAKGTPVINLINIEAQETVTAVVSAGAFNGSDYLAMATKLGEIKKVAIGEFASVRSSGLIAMDLEPGDELGWVRQLRRSSDVILVTVQGQAARFNEGAVPSRSRGAGGVRSMRLAKGDEVCSMDVVTPGSALLVVTARGFAKRTPVEQFPIHNRGVGGVIVLKVSDRTGTIVSARIVRGDEDVVAMPTSGKMFRTSVSNISIQGRAASGVILMDPSPGVISAVALLTGDESEPTNGDDEDDPAPRARGRRGASPAGTTRRQPRSNPSPGNGRDDQ
jgi:DNA gyrase subunit A